MNDPKLKTQIAEKIKTSSNILVTVSNDPSVDELSAALGLTLLLNKMEKHSTAIFSGQTPPAITFLNPQKTFENTTDSLRDFIIALDKEKADHLRYKLEGDLVKIYITPYKATITEEDLEFSQGDYNVELVIALGVKNKEHLDAALEGHGKILHDATVITLTAGEQTSNLGSIDWHDANASSLSEMLVTLYESMKLDKKLLDKSIATAWLTGIVAATERFSNPRTTSRVMTLAANLMAAGADQQLIAAKLEEAEEQEQKGEATASPQAADGKETLAEGKRAKLSSRKKQSPQEDESSGVRDDGALVISHARQGTVEEVAAEVGAEQLEASARAAERALEKQKEATAAQQDQDQTPPPEVPRGPVEYAPPTVDPSSSRAPESIEPSLGGTLNATSEQAAEDKRREQESEKNKIILSRSYIGNQQPTYEAPINSTVAGEGSAPSAGLFGSATAETVPPVETTSAPTVPAKDITPPGGQDLPPVVEAAPAEQPFTPSPAPTLADIDAQHRQSDDSSARAAVEAAFEAAPALVNPTPADMGLPPPPPPPTDFSGGFPPMPPADLPPERLGDILAPDPSELPQLVTPPPAAPTPIEQQAATPPTQPAPADPGQFQIPGQ